MNPLVDLIAKHGWQPIETAPTDGTPIFVLYDDGSTDYEEDTSGFEWEPYSGKDKRPWLVCPTHWRQPNPDLIALVNSVVEVCADVAKDWCENPKVAGEYIHMTIRAFKLPTESNTNGR